MLSSPWFWVDRTSLKNQGQGPLMGCGSEWGGLAHPGQESPLRRAQDCTLVTGQLQPGSEPLSCSCGDMGSACVLGFPGPRGGRLRGGPGCGLEAGSLGHAVRRPPSRASRAAVQLYWRRLRPGRCLSVTEAALLTVTAG